MGDAPPVGTVEITGPIRRADLPGLYARVCSRLAEHNDGAVSIDVAGVQCDAVAVEALARLALGARRHRCGVRLENASKDLRSLIRFMGLAEVVVAASPGAAEDRRAGRGRPSAGRR